MNHGKIFICAVLLAIILIALTTVCYHLGLPVGVAVVVNVLVGVFGAKYISKQLTK
jgi:hypothetical protein